MAPGSRLSGERPGPWWASLPKEEEEQASASGGWSTPSGEGTLAMRRGAKLGGEGPVTFTTLSSLRLGSLGAAGRGRRWGRHARGWEQVAGRRGGAGGLGGTVWAPAGAANGSPPPPILGRSPDVAGGLPEITRQREEAKAAAERLVPETWDENAQCGKR